MDKEPEQPFLRDRSELAELYPTAKTYDNKLAERAEIHAIRRAWQSKHPRIIIATIIITLLASLIILTQITVPLFMSGLVGVPIVFLLGIAWVFSCIASINYIRRLVDTNENF